MEQFNNLPVKVSVIMPAFNEERFILQAIKSLKDDYFRDNCELIVVDGMSEDGTQKIVKSFMAKGIRIKLLENPGRSQAYGMNLGIAEAQGDIILRADAHCIYPQGYIKQCIKMLEDTGAANVGGMMFPQGEDEGQKAIALALSHPVGVGDARWHLGKYKGFVDTVYLGAFRKSLFDDVGLYDPKAVPNEDAELNLRILKAGKKIYIDGSLKVEYFPRESFKKLAKQYFRYGKGRAYTTLKHKAMTSWRQAAPVALVVGLVLSGGIGFWLPFFWGLPLVYLLVLVGIALKTGKTEKNTLLHCYIVKLLKIFKPGKTGKAEKPGKTGETGKADKEGGVVSVKQRLMTAGAWAVMHVCWGVGFLAYFTSRKNRIG